MQYIESMNAT